MVYLWDEEIIVAYIAKNNTPLPPSQFIIRFVFNPKFDQTVYSKEFIIIVHFR